MLFCHRPHLAENFNIFWIHPKKEIFFQTKKFTFGDIEIDDQFGNDKDTIEYNETDHHNLQ